MSVFSIKNIRTAAKSRSKIKLNSHIVSTNDFGFIQPIYCREVVPGDQFNGNVRTFVRLAPMPVPTFSHLKVIQRCFYVRFRNVWQGWDDFYSQRSFNSVEDVLGKDELVPWFTNLDFIVKFLPYKRLDGTDYYDLDAGKSNQFVNYVDEDVTESITAESLKKTFDIIYKSYNDKGSVTTNDLYIKRITGYRFTLLGRRLMTVMRGLGYSINWTVVEKTNGTTLQRDITPMSALPLMCYCRAFYDYVLPSKYSNDLIWRNLFEYRWSSGNYRLLFDELFDYVVNSFYNFYENEYFTSSWETPYSPISAGNNGVGSYLSDFSRDIEGNQIGGDNIIFHSDYGSVIVSDDNASGPLSYISKYALDAVQAIYSWGTRKGLAGNKYFESIFSQFGVKLPNVLTNRCEFLGSDIQEVMISDVMSTAQTDNNGSVTPLGDYAGKGICNSPNCRFNFEANDFGMLIVTSQIIPDTGYVQGRNREVLHLSPFDFFNPEFDALGMQAIRNDELYSCYSSSSDYFGGLNVGGKPDGIFGYVPRYTEYKTGRDLLNGDFSVSSLNSENEQDSYHTFRLFSPPSGQYPLANTESFRQINPSSDGSNFDRIFNDRTQDADHFITEHWVDVDSFRKMVSVQDSIDIDGGQMVTVDPDNNISN